MSSINVNQYGLTRNIDEETKRAIRKRCGFGCVYCGSAFYQYEHIYPDFADAKLHDPEKIVLLCGGCHDRVTRKFLSKEAVYKKSISPKCHEVGYSFGAMDVSSDVLSLRFGGAVFKNLKTAIQICNDRVFSVSPPDVLGSPMRISAFICDSNGKEILNIDNNEWKTPIGNWDVTVIGGKVTIREKKGKISVVLRIDNPREVVFERVYMMHKGFTVDCSENKVKFLDPSGSVFEGKALQVSSCDIGILLFDKGRIFGALSDSHDRHCKKCSKN
jgi:hypothetical protein